MPGVAIFRRSLKSLISVHSVRTPTFRVLPLAFLGFLLFHSLVRPLPQFFDRFGFGVARLFSASPLEPSWLFHSASSRKPGRRVSLSAPKRVAESVQPRNAMRLCSMMGKEHEQNNDGNRNSQQPQWNRHLYSSVLPGTLNEPALIPRPVAVLPTARLAEKASAAAPGQNPWARLDGIDPLSRSTNTITSWQPLGASNFPHLGGVPQAVCCTASVRCTGASVSETKFVMR